MRRWTVLGVLLLALIGQVHAQSTVLQGYVFESGNRGYLNMVRIKVYDVATNTLIQRTESNLEGVFTVDLPPGIAIRITAEKDLFEKAEMTASTKVDPPGEKVFVKIKMERKPGYLFDVTVAERRREKDAPTDAISGALIEVYNNTKRESVLELKDYPHPNFKVNFENGNHYTLMIRKDGFYAKRMEAYVNVKGCILCFDGVGEVQPGVSDVLTEGHSMGTLLANVELDPVEMDKSIRLEKIYYDKNKAAIREDAAEELDKVIVLMKDNPGILLELSSHTDARGDYRQNQKLSQRRAESAVKYIVAGGIEPFRIKAKGYGESKLINSCGNDVDCPEKKHQRNRRTEIKVTGRLSSSSYDLKSLVDIIAEENFEKTLLEIQNQEVLKIPEDGELPEEIRRQMEEQEKAKATKADPPEPAEAPEPTAPAAKPSPAKDELATTTPSAATEPASTPQQQSQPPITIAEIERSKRRISKSEPVGSTPAATGTDLPDPKLKVQVVKEQIAIDPRPPFEPSEASNSNGGIVEERVLEVKQYQKKPRLIPNNFTGYMVEFYNSPYELPASHEIFSKHGDISLEQTKDGGYAYLLGNFDNWRDANKFLNSIMLANYPDAQVVRYKKGRRLKP
ncbi:MAG: OmpA family protein [Bacteroidota bacterium]